MRETEPATSTSNTSRGTGERATGGRSVACGAAGAPFRALPNSRAVSHRDIGPSSSLEFDTDPLIERLRDRVKEQAGDSERERHGGVQGRAHLDPLERLRRLRDVG